MGHKRGYTAKEHSSESPVVAEIAAIEKRIGHSGVWHDLGDAERGRNLFTRSVDRLLDATKKLRPLEWLITRSFGSLLFLYTLLVGVTARFVPEIWVGSARLPHPAVIAIWHGRAPALLVAVRARRVEGPLAIMVATGPRGDALALLCRLLGFLVVRGDERSGGWEALAELASHVETGASAVLTVDGNGPAGVVKPGAIALASATKAPLVAVSTACRPSLTLRHKWDEARNPLPFGRISLAAAPALTVGPIRDESALAAETARLGQALAAATTAAKRSLGGLDR